MREASGLTISLPLGPKASPAAKIGEEKNGLRETQNGEGPHKSLQVGWELADLRVQTISEWEGSPKHFGQVGL